MEYNLKMETTLQTENANPHKNRVHKILAHSYSVYFILFLIGVCLSFIFPLKVFGSSAAIPLGFILLVFATFLIVWAQKTSRNLEKNNVSKESFSRGPYRYTRAPTHLGLLFLLLGFGLIANSFFITFFTLLSFIIGKFVFLKEEERILAEKYGASYLEYKKIVKF